MIPLTKQYRAWRTIDSLLANVLPCHSNSRIRTDIIPANSLLSLGNFQEISGSIYRKNGAYLIDALEYNLYRVNISGWDLRKSERRAKDSIT